jgi:beta-galactosidase/beta-glucuronidase
MAAILKIPRPEYPRPQFERAAWKNLNGEWQYELDQSRSGLERGLAKNDREFSGKILVPFCPQSRCSGVGCTDFIGGIWYRRELVLTTEQLAGRVQLHFGAVDYRATVFVNGWKAGTHTGGYTSFSFDITDFLREGENVLKVYAEDDERDPLVPTGKQSDRYASYQCCYTRTTGIWQTVWLEFLPETHLVRTAYEPDAANSRLTIRAEVCGAAELTAIARYEGREVGRASRRVEGGGCTLELALSEKHLWEAGCGRLYDLELQYGEDKVRSYFGLRDIRLEGGRFLLNGKPVFQRLVLDQGFYPDGIYTAPEDADLEKDIRLSMSFGFNGARLHEKIFEERFLWYCDRMGYLVWGEYPNWGLDHADPRCVYSLLPEWLSEVQRDRSHPAIIGWCPFNETWDVEGRKQYDEALRLVYETTKAVDPTRPCIDTSGNFHVETDIFDVHDYDQDPASFRAHYDKLMADGSLYDPHGERQHYRKGQPVFVSEYGGIRWTDEASGWGYGDAPATLEEFYSRFRGLTEALLQNSRMLGLCYTQLTDVEQEQNGLCRYDRTPKFDPERLRAVLTERAAAEEESRN